MEYKKKKTYAAKHRSFSFLKESPIIGQKDFWFAFIASGVCEIMKAFICIGIKATSLTNMSRRETNIKRLFNFCLLIYTFILLKIKYILTFNRPNYVM